jgi:iron complex transport system ATP-binding protein
MLSVRHLSVTVGHSTLLAGVSLDVLPGEVVAVVGPNGAGKSTLVRVLCGDLAPTAGEVLLEERRLATWRLRERAKVIAVLPQDASLTFPFTALEVVLMGRTPHLKGREQRHDYDVTYAALQEVEVLTLAHRFYPTLSGGERQRVQLARVLAQIWDVPPTGQRYLLLDEPTTSLDLAHQHSILTTAQRFARQGTGVLTIVHDLNLAAQYADRIVVLHAGQQLATGPPHEVLTPEMIQIAFAMSAWVLPHPALSCPLVVPVPYSECYPRLYPLQEAMSLSEKGCGYGSAAARQNYPHLDPLASREGVKTC